MNSATQAQVLFQERGSSEVGQILEKEWCHEWLAAQKRIRIADLFLLLSQRGPEKGIAKPSRPDTSVCYCYDVADEQGSRATLKVYRKPSARQPGSLGGGCP